MQMRRAMSHTSFLQGVIDKIAAAGFGEYNSCSSVFWRLAYSFCY